MSGSKQSPNCPQQPNSNYRKDAKNDARGPTKSDGNRAGCFNPKNMGAQEFPCNPCNAYTDTSANSFLSPAQKACCCNLEYEMAKSKILILERLRADEIGAQRFQGFENNAKMPDPYFGLKTGTWFCRIDMDRVRSFNYQTNKPSPTDNQYVDVTIRRVSLPPPKQRARSCPAPVQRVNLRPSLQRLPRAYPRAGPLVHASPSRSASDVRQNSRSPIAEVNDSSSAFILKAVAARTTTRNVSSQQNQDCSDAESPPGPSDGRTKRPESQQNNPNNVKNDGIQMKAAYGQIPNRGFAQFQYEAIQTEPNGQYTNTNYHRLDAIVGSSTSVAEGIRQDKSSGQKKKVAAQSNLNKMQQNRAARPPSGALDQNRENKGVHRTLSSAGPLDAKDAGKTRPRNRSSPPPSSKGSRGSGKDNQPVVGRMPRSPANCTCPAHEPRGPEKDNKSESSKSCQRPAQPRTTSPSPAGTCPIPQSRGSERDKQPVKCKTPTTEQSRSTPSWCPYTPHESRKPDRNNQPVVGKSPRPEKPRSSPSCPAPPEKSRGAGEDYYALVEKYCRPQQPRSPTVVKHSPGPEQPRPPQSRPTPPDKSCAADEEYQAMIRKYCSVSSNLSSPPDKSRGTEKDCRQILGKYLKPKQPRPPSSSPTPPDKSCGSEEEYQSLIDKYCPKPEQPRAPPNSPPEKSRAPEEGCHEIVGKYSLRPPRPPSNSPTPPDKSCGSEEDYKSLIDKYCPKAEQPRAPPSCPPEKPRAPEEDCHEIVGKYCLRPTRPPSRSPTPEDKSCDSEEDCQSLVGKYYSRPEQPRAPPSRPPEKNRGAKEECHEIVGKFCPRPTRPPSRSQTPADKNRGPKEDCHEIVGKYCLRPTRPPSRSPSPVDKCRDADQDYQAIISKFCSNSPAPTQTNAICPAPEQSESGDPEEECGHQIVGRFRPRQVSSEETFYYNTSIFNEPSQYGKKQTDYPENSDEIQCECEEMVINGQNLLSWEACASHEDDALAFMIKSSFGKITPTDPDMGIEDLKCPEQPELPPSSLNVNQNCIPNEQPRASLFRCLAQKLSSTYDFISGLVSPEKSTEGDRPREESESVKECNRAKRCGHIQFDEVDKNKLQNPRRTAIRKAEIENLVKDTYCPGLIQETIDGRENFNCFSFNISFCQQPKENTKPGDPSDEDPMTLLEAFTIRIELEREEMTKNLKEDATDQQIEDTIVQHFANKNPSALNRAIKSLLLSERKQEREKQVESKTTSLDADVQKWATIFPNNSKEEVIAYTGRTKPLAVGSV